MAGESCHKGRGFPVTRWSLVARAGRESHESRRKALGELLDLYHPALKSHLVGVLRIPDDQADDLVQGFVVRKILERNVLSRANREKGRFRTFLLKVFTNYVISEIRRARAGKKATADSKVIHLAEHPDAVSCTTEPGGAFDLAWARQVLVETLRRMKTECEEGKRTDNPDARIARITVPFGTVAVAVDYSSADAEFPDTIRVDFTGEGVFEDQNTIQYVPKTDRSHFGAWNEFGPKILQIKRDGNTIPIVTSGRYRHSSEEFFKHLELEFCVAVEKACPFGGAVYKVRLADASGKLGFSSQEHTWKDGQLELVMGSSLFVDADGNGSFTLKGQYGQPLLVNDQWYELRFDGTNMSAQALNIQSARVLLPPGTESCRVASKKYLVSFSGKDAPGSIPSDDYGVVAYAYGAEGGWMFASGPRVENGEPKMLAFPANEVTEVPLGDPLTVWVNAKQTMSGIMLSLDVTDKAGGQISRMRTPPRREDSQAGNRVLRSPGGEQVRRPPMPKVTIADSQGKTVHETRLEFQGRQSDAIICERVWQPPAGMKGTFTVSVAFDTWPFESTCEQTIVTVK